MIVWYKGVEFGRSPFSVSDRVSEGSGCVGRGTSGESRREKTRRGREVGRYDGGRQETGVVSCFRKGVGENKNDEED